MASPEYSIVPVLEADLPFLANLTHAAKLSLSINRLIFENWPNEVLQKEMYSNAVLRGYSEPSLECFKAVDANSNEIIGYFVLARKQPVEEDLIDNGNEASRQATPDGLNRGLYGELITATTKIAKRTEAIDRFG
jgi:hypothetical protein